MAFVTLSNRMKSKALFAILLLFSSLVFSQVERETRAVWLTTNHRLDWPPPSYNAEKQKKALADIFDDLKTKNFNTVYFQVRSNGTVMFNSSFEPLSQYITGEVDGNASYDPLKYAVEQAHKHGLEIHAWVNACLVYNGTEQAVLKSKNHLSQKKPEWIVEDVRDGQKSLWLDPGLPEVKSYLTDLILEMVENYDIDGVHLDYIRYPGKNFEDDFSYNIHGGGLTRDEFRRKNITAIVEEIYKQVKSVKPFVKVGAAPIGVYKKLPGMTAWESYYDIYQDSYGWMKKGIVDYLTPQIYWSLDENPRFDLLAKDWKANSNGRGVVLGIGAYKENVKPELEEMIGLSRNLKVDGVSFFRYQHIKDVNFPSYRYKTFPAAMPWLQVIYPPAPVSLSLNRQEGKNLFTLNWEVEKNSNPNDSVNYFAIYNLPRSNSETLTEYLFDVVPAPRTSVTLAIDKPKKVNYFFRVKSVNKLWNESIESSEAVKVEIPLMKELAQLNETLLQPLLIKESDKSAAVVIQCGEKQSVEIFGGKGKVFSLLKKESASIGKNIFTIKKELKNYDVLKIVFGASKKEVELKLL
ncbi:MAG: hypothetical protein A2499_06160 [Stygiobacter sp. RIFOXYC12_FULL_38_8]|nr:MAG: hypothetical protein A2299_04840 [Stygiobacter sp. RIFOXYB2_FULL_37_11]OGV10390.1 MAG: hypothetical protein A2237_07575 [Stygiobacter sp. RIFOXYA2_FULL_38_8]OGV14596.1 MAG: hypothetical protein A2440_09170 [Stygiobacter sp. RIFOXYC2_FULL_38_25]OGV29302.1 MAG: hypothetical protein A2499_06160 [Stygiobacter sp. RIFOXYC12_FULL_38_8]OGV81475.1 MAG: hypothetical protein A2X65_10945 [Stygiobacter sp. GWF2_38_21]RJQ61107.1 MAG: hypothetical protein C4517_09165 [Stygiobacter sp.]